MILRSLVFKSDGVGHLRLDVLLASPPTAKEKKKCLQMKINALQ